MLFNPDLIPDRYINNDKESILYFEMLEQEKSQLTRKFAKKIIKYLFN